MASMDAVGGVEGRFMRRLICGEYTQWDKRRKSGEMALELCKETSKVCICLSADCSI